MRDHASSRAQQIRRYRQIVAHFERVAHANLTSAAHIADLCRVAGVNQRTLSRAFRAVRGATPYHCLQELRVNEGKRALSLEEGTVTQVAIRFGFNDLGRFAARYRRIFGENPSETKQRGRGPMQL